MITGGHGPTKQLQDIKFIGVHKVLQHIISMSLCLRVQYTIHNSLNRGLLDLPAFNDDFSGA